MHLNGEGKARVSPRDFWFAVLTVALMFGSLGVFEVQTGHAPRASPWMVTCFHGLEAIFLVGLWTVFLVRMAGNSRNVYTVMNVVAMIGCTLIFGSDLIPHLGHATDWAKNTGLFLIILTILPDFLTFGKRPPTVPPEKTLNQPGP